MGEGREGLRQFQVFFFCRGISFMGRGIRLRFYFLVVVGLGFECLFLLGGRCSFRGFGSKGQELFRGFWEILGFLEVSLRLQGQGDLQLQFFISRWVIASIFVFIYYILISLSILVLVSTVFRVVFCCGFLVSR